MNRAQRRLAVRGLLLVVVIGVLDWLYNEGRAHAAVAGLLLTLLLLAGVLAGIGWWAARMVKARRARERELVRLEEEAQRRWARQRQLRDLQVFLAMDPREFEESLAELCRRDGCTFVRVVGGSGDLGADVIARTPDGRVMVIQAKRFGPRNRVGSQAVQIVNGTARDQHGADLAVIVTTSSFTRQAREFAGRVGIVLVDEQGLAGWANQSGSAPWN
ncbi:restriction endonuclease [Streptacidiphilus jiangxiensis]|uniref:Restriction system protein n=1 Tax=Streptacidiphilus jiangxiensis TaxID=235985 RepID=A0A1H8ACB2_STRJI|nr:restriction endonuclease [Streptacidiphilus jiangxiensis]SEM68193.1 restriction system protein [Streptacidiphilus jiangxiensis]